MAVCEPTSFREPILVYGKGAVVNLYNVILQDTLNFKYVAVAENSFKIDESSGEIMINLVE